MIISSLLQIIMESFLLALLGSFSNDNGNDKENITWKYENINLGNNIIVLQFWQTTQMDFKEQCWPKYSTYDSPSYVGVVVKTVNKLIWCYCFQNGSTEYYSKGMYCCTYSAIIIFSSYVQSNFNFSLCHCHWCLSWWFVHVHHYLGLFIAILKQYMTYLCWLFTFWCIWKEGKLLWKTESTLTKLMQRNQVAGICVTNLNLEYLFHNVVTNQDVYNEVFTLNTSSTNLLQLYVGLVCEVTFTFIDMQ